MGADVDLRELAVERGGEPTSMRGRRHVLTRYVLPATLMLGFLSLAAWAARDAVFPPRRVTVVPVVVATSQVRQEGVPLFQAAGWIEPRPTSVRVAALAPGVVEELLVVEDQAVVAGEPIAELVKADARLAHESALSDLELRRAELEAATASMAAAETRLAQPVHLEAALGEAEAALRKIATELTNLPFGLRRAQADYEAMRATYEAKVAAQGVVPGVEIDVAKASEETAQALVEELRDRRASLESEQAALTRRRDALRMQLRLLADEIKARDESKAIVRAAKARVTQSEVAVAKAKLQLDRMTVVAPIAGRVYQLVTQPGARLSAGAGNSSSFDMSTVVTIYRPDRLQVRVDVRFENVPQVSLGQPVEIGNPALVQPLTGRVLFVSSEADIQKNTLQVKVEIPDSPPVFKPEMLVDVTFLSPKPLATAAEPSQELTLYAPSRLIQQSDSDAFVWVADQSAGVARRTIVETGESGASGLIEIASGLHVTSRLITSGAEGLRDGERVVVAGEDASLGTSPPSGAATGAKSLSRLPLKGKS